MRQSLTINVGSWAGAEICGGKNKDFFLRPKFSSILPFWGGQFIASQIIIFSVTEEKCKRREASKPANPRQHCRLPIHEYTRIGRPLPANCPLMDCLALASFAPHHPRFEGGRFPQVLIFKPNKDLSPRWSYLVRFPNPLLEVRQGPCLKDIF